MTRQKDWANIRISRKTLSAMSEVGQRLHLSAQAVADIVLEEMLEVSRSQDELEAFFGDLVLRHYRRLVRGSKDADPANPSASRHNTDSFFARKGAG